MSFSENLQHLRKRNNLTQEQLAERLDVSRQAVSKWESGQSYPEMDKMLQLCQLFGCNLDTLVNGDVTAEDNLDPAGYDRQMNRFAFMTATAVSMIIVAVGLMVILEQVLKGIVHEDVIIIGMFAVIGIAVAALIVNGINQNYFRKRYANIRNFYTEDERYHFNRKFAVAVAAGVCLIFLGICINLGLEHVGNPVVVEAGGGIFLLCTAAAVWIFICFGILKSKYEVEGYNRRNSGERDRGEVLTGKISGVIMLLATAIFLYLGIVHNMFRVAWIVYPIGGVLCGVADIIVKDKH